LFITEDFDSIIEQVVGELRQQYPRMIHLRCIGRLLGDIKDNIRLTYPKVARLYEKTRNFFWPLSTEGKDFYKETKFRKDKYYFLDFCAILSIHFDTIKRYFIETNFKIKQYKIDYSCIKGLFDDPELKTQIAEIFSKYNFLRQVRGLIRDFPKAELVQSVSVFEQLFSYMKNLANSTHATKDDREIFEQLTKLLKPNTGFTQIQSIALYLSGNDSARKLTDFPLHLSDGDIVRFRYAPLGGINRKWCFPNADELICLSLDKYPIEYIDELSVEKCFGLCYSYEQMQRLYFNKLF